MNLVNTKAKIVEVIDLSPTSRELIIVPEKSFDFIPGMFVNIFIEHGGKKIRRAYSISSDPAQKENFSISARLLPGGEMSPIFWADDIAHREITVMGPMGFNTIEKITKDRVFLFAFGIGASVIKSIAHELSKRENIQELFIMTGNRNESEMIYKDFFDSLAREHKNVVVRHVLSRPENLEYEFTGHVPDFLADLDFSNSSVYACGSTKACESLKEKIESMNPANVDIVVEAFG